MTTPAVVILGYRVVEWGENKRGAKVEVRLSGRYVARSAAERCLRVAHEQGHPGALIKVEHRTDRAGLL